VQPLEFWTWSVRHDDKKNESKSKTLRFATGDNIIIAMNTVGLLKFQWGRIPCRRPAIGALRVIGKFIGLGMR